MRRNIYFYLGLTILIVSIYSCRRPKPEPEDPSSNAPYVDLGLSVKWASLNVGANNTQDRGYYYAWGESSIKNTYEWQNYKFGDRDDIDKYNHDDRLSNLMFDDDAASVVMGRNYRIPTTDEIKELTERCSWETTILNGTTVCKITGPNGNYIYLPYSGHYEGEELCLADEEVSFWSSTIDTSNIIKAHSIAFSISENSTKSIERCHGLTIRAVYDSCLIVNYIANNGSSDKYQIRNKAGNITIEDNNFVNSGYIFTKWNTKADGSGISYNAGQNITLNEDLTLYAQWSEVIYRAEYHSNTADNETYTENIGSGETYAIISCPFSYDGLSFIGWNTSSDGSGTAYEVGQEMVVNDDITLYAQWEASSHKVIYRANNSSDDCIEELVTHNNTHAIMSCPFSYDGFSFTNWNTNSDGSGTTYEVGQEIMVNNDITLYAQWETSSHKVIYLANNGSDDSIEEQVAHNNSHAIMSCPFSYDGFSFTNWNTSSDGSGTTYEVGQEIIVDNDITLYAQWETSSQYIAIDLGLSVKWAKNNIGAENAEDAGNYFAWGELEPKTTYTESNSATTGITLSDISGNANYDAARANWGGSWRIPTNAEIQELINRCTWTWTTQNNKSGYLITGPNGNSIFIPFAGCYLDSSLVSTDYGFYWSSTPEDNTYGAYGFIANSYNYAWDRSFRYIGRTIRPVCE